jgi:hypothetical protein
MRCEDRTVWQVRHAHKMLGAAVGRFLARDFGLGRGLEWLRDGPCAARYSVPMKGRCFAPTPNRAWLAASRVSTAAVPAAIIAASILSQERIASNAVDARRAAEGLRLKAQPCISAPFLGGTIAFEALGLRGRRRSFVHDRRLPRCRRAGEHARRATRRALQGIAIIIGSCPNAWCSSDDAAIAISG